MFVPAPPAGAAGIGAAGAGATLLGLDEGRAGHALATAATQAAGLTASFGTMAKPFHAGKAAMDGVIAAEVAARGFEGKPSILEPSGGLDRAIIQLGLVSERQLLEVMSEQLHLPLVKLDEITILPETLRVLPSKIVYRKRLVPISQSNGTLNVATSDAFDLYAFDDIRLMTGLNIQPVLAPSEDIEKIIKTHYGLGGDTLDEMVGANDLDTPGASVEGGEDLLEMAQEASVIKLVNEIILEAVNERASDIHIEPYEHEMSIRYRIDGVLQEASVPPLSP